VDVVMARASMIGMVGARNIIVVGVLLIATRCGPPT
jgi:hypothetical protein